MRKLKKSTWIILFIVCIAILAAALFFLLRYLMNTETPREAFAPTAVPAASAGETEAPTVVTDETQTPTEKGPLTAWGYELAQPGDFDVDFDSLTAINTDIYAWIYIPNTNVDYPVARSSGDGDDSFYLEHNIYRQYQFSGTIYSEIKNQPDMHDRVTVMYGHNMLNGSMFATLLNFEDKEFFDQNNTIFVYTKDKIFTYLLYSAYTYDDRHILNSFFFEDDKMFTEYLEGTLNPHSYNENVREGVVLDTSNKILTLSTCTNGASNTRYLVQGVLVDERDR